MASPLTIQPDATAGKDAMLYAYTANTNYGASYVNAIVGKYSTQATNYGRMVIAFDVSSVPSTAQVTGTTLSMFEMAAGRSAGGPSSWATDVRSVLVAWDEEVCTWNTRNSGNQWNSAGCSGDGTDRTQTPKASITSDSTAANAFVDWSGSGMTSDVQAAVAAAGSVNWLVSAETTESLGAELAYTRYYSSDYTTDTTKRPKLVVTYTIKQTYQASATIAAISATEAAGTLTGRSSATIAATSTTQAVANVFGLSSAVFDAVSAVSAAGDYIHEAIMEASVTIAAVSAMTARAYRALPFTPKRPFRAQLASRDTTLRVRVEDAPTLRVRQGE